MQTITLFGTDGTEPAPNIDDLRESLNHEIARLEADPNHTQPIEDWRVLERILAAFHIAGYHNRLIPLITGYRQATNAARAAVRAADAAYNDLALRTTTAWHAAHYRYILAVTDAQDALAEQVAAGALIDGHRQQHSGIVASFYDQLVPEAQRITIPDTGDRAAEIAAFTETTRRRLHLLSFTITGQVPAGFEPEQVPTDQDQPVDIFKLESRFDEQRRNGW